MQDRHRILVADDQRVQSQVAVELFDPAQRDVVDQVMLEVQSLQRLRVVLDQNTFASSLSSTNSTYFSCLTMAEIMVE